VTELLTADRGPIPGGGPTNREGLPIALPIASTSTDLELFNGDCILMGWSLRESTALAGAICELYDGGGVGGVLLGSVALMTAADLIASQSPNDAQASGANAALAPTIGGVAGVTEFLSSIEITGLGATAAGEVTATLTGGLGGPINYPIAVPAGVATPIVNIFDNFGGRGLQAAAAGTAFVLNVPAFGAGNTLAEAALQGYAQGTVGFAETKWFGPDGIYVQGGLFLHLVLGSVKGTIWFRR
jgi:hypothetical protein